MDYIINKKNFEFMKNFLESPIDYGSLFFHQIGECMLECGGAIESHNQECFEISYVISGYGKFAVDGTEYKLSAGDVHLICPGKIHGITTDCSEGFRFAYLGFSFSDSLDDAETEKIREFYTGATSHILKDNGNIYPLMRMLIDEWYSDSKLNYTVIISLLKCILVLTSRLFGEKENSGYVPDYRDDVLGRNIYSIVQYIDNNATEITGIDMIAQKFGYTSNYVSHLFKAKIGTSVQNYIIEKKMGIASNLLINTNCSITEIAERLKYSSLQSFCKMFKKWNGLTPTRYRENYYKYRQERNL
ncbi:MAG: helix-turn-helix domain-containing protein [Clostridia bacterium]|nr:helix-turn-helix domain-containing protein [Clostridia bacterium]